MHRVYGDIGGVSECGGDKGLVVLAEGGKRSDLAHGLVANLGLEHVDIDDPELRFDEQNLMNHHHGVGS